MSEILKNTASQSVFVTVIDSATGGGKTSGVSFTYTAAGGSQTALTNTPTHKGNGQYEVVPTQAETNVDCFSIGWYGSGVVPNCVTIYTTTKRLRDLQDLAAGEAMTLTAAYDKAKDDVLTPLAVIDALVDTLIDRLTATRAGYLDAAISSRGTLTAGQVRTELATELARILKGLPDAIPGQNGGLPTTNGTKINQTADLTAGQSIACADKTGFSLSATGLDLVTAPASGSALKAIKDKADNIPASPAESGEYASDIANILAGVLEGNATTSGIALLAAAMSKLQQADIKLNTTTTPWTEEYYEKGTATLLMTKVLYDENGDGITSIASYIGRRMHT